MNNKEKYIAEVDSLRAGEELKNAILENAQLKPKKNVYKKIIPLAACLVIAVLAALPGIVLRAGRAKNAAQESAYDSAVAENEIAFAEENADSKSAKSESESGVWYVDTLNSRAGVEMPAVILTFSDSEKSFTLNSVQSKTVSDIVFSVGATAEPAEETDKTLGSNYAKFEYSGYTCFYYPGTGIADINGTFYELDDESKNRFDDILSQFTDR